jgi:hypothetical protein
MTVLHPCLHCHRRPDCEIKARTLTLLKGSGITKANLKCSVPEKDFPPGSVVMVKAFELVEDCEDFTPTPTSRRAVVRQWRNRLASVVLEKDQEIAQPSSNPIAYLKVPSDRLTLVDEPVRVLCRCGLDAVRCESNDYPSVRNGEWYCQEDIPR